MPELFRRNGNSFTSINIGGGSGGSTIYEVDESEVGTWIDNKILYRSVCTPTTLTVDNTLGDTLHYTYKTDIQIQDVDTMVSGLFLGIDSNNIKFSTPCQVFVYNTYLYISSFTSLTVAENGITIIVEYTKNDDLPEESES